MSRLKFCFLLAVVLLLGACNNQSDIPTAPTLPPPEETGLVTSPTNVGIPATLASPQGSATRLNIWLPPFLNPTLDTPAVGLLRKRLEEFQARNPNVIIETRVKAVTGPGGLLDSLTTASAAAPATLPDLVALPRDLEEAAALKGLLLPLDDLTASINDPDWYPYAEELAHLQNNVYGFPFAGDAIIQIYHSEQITTVLTSWRSVIDRGASLIFPAASQQALFTLSEYQANGGLLRDDQGRPMLDATKLSEVFVFYQKCVEAGVMPASLLIQLQDDEQAWEAFIDGETQVLIGWSSRALSEKSAGMAISPIPTANGKPFALATGWVWSLVGRDEEKRRLAVELGEFLTDSHFLADWSQAAGFLPTRPSSLGLWTDRRLSEAVGRISAATYLLPPTDILTILVSPLQQAGLSVVKGEADPESAAETASSSLTSP